MYTWPSQKTSTNCHARSQFLHHKVAFYPEIWAVMKWLQIRWCVFGCLITQKVNGRFPQKDKCLSLQDVCRWTTLEYDVKMTAKATLTKASNITQRDIYCIRYVYTFPILSFPHCSSPFIKVYQNKAISHVYYRPIFYELNRKNDLLVYQIYLMNFLHIMLIIYLSRNKWDISSFLTYYQSESVRGQNCGTYTNNFRLFKNKLKNHI